MLQQSPREDFVPFKKADPLVRTPKERRTDGSSMFVDHSQSKAVTLEREGRRSSTLVDEATIDSRYPLTPFTMRLGGPGVLSGAQASLMAAACHNVRTVPAQQHLTVEGDKPGPVFVMIKGWACLYKILPDGERQIVAFLLPGDFSNIHASELNEIDHSVMTLTEARVATIPQSQVDALTQPDPVIRRALRRAQQVDASVARAWMVNTGRRKSVARVAHLMCELYFRMRNVGLATGNRCELPLNQTVLADSLGLTPVHLNRLLRKLRLAEIMVLGKGALVIKDMAKLTAVAGFDGNYLDLRLPSGITV